MYIRTVEKCVLMLFASKQNLAKNTCRSLPSNLETCDNESHDISSVAPFLPLRAQSIIYSETCYCTRVQYTICTQQTARKFIASFEQHSVLVCDSHEACFPLFATLCVGNGLLCRVNFARVGLVKGQSVRVCPCGFFVRNRTPATPARLFSVDAYAYKNL